MGVHAFNSIFCKFPNIILIGANILNTDNGQSQIVISTRNIKYFILKNISYGYQILNTFWNFTNYDNLKYLKMIKCCSTNGFSYVHNLKKLILIKCVFKSSIINQCINLKKLYLKNCNSIDSMKLSCKNIRHLMIDVPITYVVDLSHWSELRTLIIYHNVFCILRGFEILNKLHYVEIICRGYKKINISKLMVCKNLKELCIDKFGEAVEVIGLNELNKSVKISWKR